jgi:heat shock protein HslJ
MKPINKRSIIIITLNAICIAIFTPSLKADPLSKKDIAHLHYLVGEISTVKMNGTNKSRQELCGSPETKLTIEFSSIGQMRGTACCNDFSGSYEIKPNSNEIKLGKLTMTSVGCLSTPQDDFDILKILNSLDRIELVDNRLVLSSQLGINKFEYQLSKKVS